MPPLLLHVSRHTPGGGEGGEGGEGGGGDGGGDGGGGGGDGGRTNDRSSSFMGSEVMLNNTMVVAMPSASSKSLSCDTEARARDLERLVPVAGVPVGGQVS
jgi:hypothetical protein